MQTLDTRDAVAPRGRVFVLEDGVAIADASGIADIWYDHGVVLSPAKRRTAFDVAVPVLAAVLALGAGAVIATLSRGLIIDGSSSLRDSALTVFSYTAGYGLLLLGAVLSGIVGVLAISGQPARLSDVSGFNRFGRRTAFVESDTAAKELGETVAVLTAAGVEDIVSSEQFERVVSDTAAGEYELASDDIFFDRGGEEYEPQSTAEPVAEEDTATAAAGGSTKWRGSLDGFEWKRQSPFANLGAASEAPAPELITEAPPLIGDEALAALDISCVPLVFSADTLDVETLNFDGLVDAELARRPESKSIVVAYGASDPQSASIAAAVIVAAARGTRFVVTSSGVAVVASPDGQPSAVLVRQDASQSRTVDRTVSLALLAGRFGSMRALPRPAGGRHRGWWVN